MLHAASQLVGSIRTYEETTTFLADRTNGRAYATMFRPFVCEVMYA